MNSDRIKWIDVAKGFCIFLVVLGHCITRNGVGKVAFISRLISSFHMPLFFILSGVNLKADKPFAAFIKSKSVKILLPTYAFIIIYYLCMTGLNALDSSYAHYILPNSLDMPDILIKTVLCMRGSLVDNWWFLPALFSAQIILFIINRVRQLYLKLIVITICLFLYIFNSLRPAIVFPFFFEAAVLALPFVAIGFYGKKLLNTQDNLSKIITSFLTWILCITISVKCDYGAMSMWNCRIYNPILFLIGGISGSYIIIYFAKRAENVSLLRRLGTQTLWIYGIHYIFLNIFCETVNQFVKNQNFLFNLLLVFAGKVIILLCSCFTIFYRFMKRTVNQ